MPTFGESAMVKILQSFVQYNIVWKRPFVKWRGGHTGDRENTRACKYEHIDFNVGGHTGDRARAWAKDFARESEWICSIIFFTRFVYRRLGPQPTFMQYLRAAHLLSEALHATSLSPVWPPSRVAWDLTQHLLQNIYLMLWNYCQCGRYLRVIWSNTRPLGNRRPLII